MIQGPEPGEYRGLSLDDRRRMNEMYRDLNAWNARALKIIEAGQAGECSCEWFAPGGDPYCAIHAPNTDTEQA